MANNIISKLAGVKVDLCKGYSVFESNLLKGLLKLARYENLVDIKITALGKQVVEHLFKCMHQL